jgi:glutamine synthetase
VKGLSRMAYWFIGGILHHARALTALTSPIVNSYKRLVRGAPRSGASWAPVYITYGGNNRTQMIRVPGGGRIENRMVDGACNPYLAITGLFASRSRRIANKMTQASATKRTCTNYPRRNCIGARLASCRPCCPRPSTVWSTNEVLCNALGRTYAQYYVDIKREEGRQHHQSVSQWDLDHCLGVY